MPILNNRCMFMSIFHVIQNEFKKRKKKNGSQKLLDSWINKIFIGISSWIKLNFDHDRKYIKPLYIGIYRDLEVFWFPSNSSGS